MTKQEIEPGRLLELELKLMVFLLFLLISMHQIVGLVG